MQEVLEFIKNNANYIVPFFVCLVVAILVSIIRSAFNMNKLKAELNAKKELSQKAQQSAPAEPTNPVEDEPTETESFPVADEEPQSPITIDVEVLDTTVKGLLDNLFADEEDEDDAQDNDFASDEESEENTPFPHQKYLDILKDQEGYQIALQREKNGEGKIYYHTRMNFLSRLALSSKTLQENYLAIKKYLLSYKNVSARMSIYGESFKISKTKLAKLDIREGNLYLYLATPYKELKNPRYNTFDVSHKKDHIETPTLTKIRGERKLAYGLELLEEELSSLGLQKKKHPEKEQITLPTYTKEELIKNASIRIFYTFVENK